MKENKSLVQEALIQMKQVEEAIKLSPEQEVIADDATEKGYGINESTSAGLSGQSQSSPAIRNNDSSNASQNSEDSTAVQATNSERIEECGNVKLKEPPQVVIDAMRKWGITTPLQKAHFLAQCGHESGGFKAVNENLNYGAKGLLGTFPKYFNATTAAQYERKPEMIASKVYGGRMGNGPESTKDGYKFRGRGYIQLTGKDNYTAFDKFVDDDILGNPDLVATKYPLMSAAWFFNKNGLWAICDKGADQGTVTAVTKRVNGGVLGLQDRIKHFKEYYNLLK